MQTFGDTVASVLHQASCPVSFWPYAGKYACDANNFKGDEDSPYHWHYKEVSKAKLYPFGASVSVVPPRELQKKFNARSWECVFLGYNSGPGGKFHVEYVASPIEDLLDEYHPFMHGSYKW